MMIKCNSDVVFMSSSNSVYIYVLALFLNKYIGTELEKRPSVFWSTMNRLVKVVLHKLGPQWVTVQLSWSPSPSTLRYAAVAPLPV